MPLASGFGTLSARAFGFLGGALAMFVLKNTYVISGPTQIVSFSGATAGDIAMVVTAKTTSETFSGWTLSGPFLFPEPDSYFIYVYTRVLTSGDISTGSITFTSGSSGGIIFIDVYRGATVATIVSTNSGNATSLAISGFTKSGSSKAVLTYCIDGSASGGTITKPTGTTQRLNFGSSVVSASEADIIPPNAYTDGSSVTWTGLDTIGSFGQIIELT